MERSMTVNQTRSQALDDTRRHIAATRKTLNAAQSAIEAGDTLTATTLMLAAHDQRVHILAALNTLAACNAWLEAKHEV